MKCAVQINRVIIITLSHLRLHGHQSAGFPPPRLLPRLLPLLFLFPLLLFLQELPPGQDQFSRIQSGLKTKINLKKLHKILTKSDRKKVEVFNVPF